MEFKENKSGFTLIELVVVIAIMGVILILALPQVSKLQQANKDKKYDAYYASVERGAKLYIDTYAKDLFGNNNSGCVTISYSKLKEQNLAKDFGSSNITCSKDSETYVEVRKVNSEYLYSTSMVCRDEKDKVVYQKSIKDDFTCANVQDEEGPKVVAEPESHDWVQTKNLKVKIKVSDPSTLNKNVGIIYYWTDLNGKKVSGDYKYNYKNKKGVQKVSYLIPTKNIPTPSGQYKLVVKPWESSSTSGIQDALGNKTLIEKSFGPYKIDNVKPTCGTVTGAKTTWTNKDFTITQGCNDDASGCEKNPYSKTFTTSRKTYDFTIKDKAGNTNSCKVNVYLDVDRPTCGKVVGESTSWTNQNRKISVGCNDTGGSNCTKPSFETIFSTEGTTDSITIADVAGNSRSCSVDKYIDKTPPSNIKITGNPGCVSQPNTITLTLSADEKESGIDYWQYGYNNMNNMTTYPNSAKSPFMTTPFSAIRNDKTYLRVCDKVGNCSYGTTQICIKNSKPDFGGNVGQWKVLNNQRSSCDFWAAHPYGGSCPSGVYGNTIGKLDVSYSGNNFTFKWAIANGGETWINNSYYVNFIIKKNGSVISTTQIKDPWGDGWFPGSTHDGTITKSLSSGSYEIFFEGNSFYPSYTASMGTIVVH